MRKIASSENARCSVALSVLRRLEVAPERLFDDDPRAFGATGARQMLDRHGKRAGWNREVEQRTLGVAEGLPDLGEELELAVVTGHVLQQRRQASERGLVDGASRRHAAPHALDQLLAGHRQPSHADDGHVQLPAGGERLKRRKNLFVREVAGDAEHDEGVGIHTRFTVTRFHLPPHVERGFNGARVRAILRSHSSNLP